MAACTRRLVLRSAPATPSPGLCPPSPTYVALLPCRGATETQCVGPNRSMHAPWLWYVGSRSARDGPRGAAVSGGAGRPCAQHPELVAAVVNAVSRSTFWAHLWSRWHTIQRHPHNPPPKRSHKNVWGQAKHVQGYLPLYPKPQCLNPSTLNPSIMSRLTGCAGGSEGYTRSPLALCASCIQFLLPGSDRSFTHRFPPSPLVLPPT